MKKRKQTLVVLLLLVTLIMTACGKQSTSDNVELPTDSEYITDTFIEIGQQIKEAETLEWLTYEGENIPSYGIFNYPSIEFGNGEARFTEEEKKITEPFEVYSELDSLGRCGVAFANICKELMPTEERGEIGQVKPSGWHTVKYDIVSGTYLYNRCHLIGYQLAGENANELNLITGTRYLNIDGMLDLENEIADYVKETGNHVLYRVTPIFVENELVARGVLMEVYSVEDKGNAFNLCEFAYNIQPGIEINYLTGESWLIGGENIVPEEKPTYTANPDGIIYILNIESKKYHLDTCRYAKSMSEENKETFNGTKEWLSDNGYEPCGVCKP